MSRADMYLYILLMLCGCCSVERDRLREQERQARAQMSSQAADRDSAGAPMTIPQTGGTPLFTGPVRVSTPTFLQKRTSRSNQFFYVTFLFNYI